MKDYKHSLTTVKKNKKKLLKLSNEKTLTDEEIKKLKVFKLKIENDLKYYLTEDKWSQKEKKQFEFLKNQIKEIENNNPISEFNQILGIYEEIQDLKNTREQEKRINKFNEKLNDDLNDNKIKKERLKNQFKIIDNIF